VLVTPSNFSSLEFQPQHQALCKYEQENTVVKSKQLIFSVSNPEDLYW